MLTGLLIEEVELHIVFFFLDRSSSSGCGSVSSCSGASCGRSSTSLHSSELLRVGQDSLNLGDLLESEIDLGAQSHDVLEGVAHHVGETGGRWNSDLTSEG